VLFLYLFLGKIIVLFVVFGGKELENVVEDLKHSVSDATIIEYGKLLFLEWGNDQRSNMVTVQITL
jgi:hypothetical protein